MKSKTLLALGAILSLAIVKSTFAFKEAITAPGQSEQAKSLLVSLEKKVKHSIAKATKKTIPAWDQERLTAQCLKDEYEYQKIHQQILLPFNNDFKNNLLSRVSPLLSSDFIGNSMEGAKIVTNKNLEQISFQKYVPTRPKLNSNDFLKGFKKMRDLFSELDFSEIVVTKVKSLPAHRGKENKMIQAQLEGRFDFRGKTKIGGRLQLRGDADIGLKRVGSHWRVNKFQLKNISKLASKNTQFRNVTAQTKLGSLVPRYLRREAIRRGGYAMAVGNYNDDGHLDLFVGTVGESVLLKGGKNLVFEKQSASELESQTLVKAAAFADFNNNGRDELLLVRFAPNEVQSENKRSDILIFNQNKSNKWSKEKTEIKFNRKTAYAMPLAIADFNGDSYLDFYVGFPGAKDFTTLGLAQHPDELTTQGIFLSKRGDLMGDSHKRNFDFVAPEVDDPSKLFPHSALAADIDQNSTMDLIVIDDRGNLSPIYLNRGKGEFEPGHEKIGVGYMDYGMGADVGDLNGDGTADFVMSAVNFNTSARLKSSCQYNWSVQDTIKAGVRGLRSFEGNSNGSFSEATAKMGLDWIGEGAGGVKLFDYNNDGHLDIYVTMGLWSGSAGDSSLDLSAPFVAGSLYGILDDDIKSEVRTDKLVYDSIIPNNDFKSLLFKSDSQSVIMDVLSFYREGNKSPSLAGHQPNRLFRNNGDGTFIEVGYLVGVDSIADGYMAAIFDHNQDGNLDLILRNADPGQSVDQFDPVEVFSNQGVKNNQSIVLELEGSSSNKDGIGALVSAKVGNKVINRQLLAAHGTVQSQKVIHIGLGSHQKADLITIKWPSGLIQTLKNVKAGRVFIYEPDKRISKR